MIMSFKNLCVALMFVMLAPLQVAADEATDVVNDVAAKLVQQLPMEKKFVLKVTSPTETGLPEAFLRSLSSDVEAALLASSSFEIQMINRSSTEELWSEAIEFGDADFEELYAASKADAAIIISPRVTPAGIEVNINVYQLLEANAGKVIAASGTFLLDINAENALGVNLETVDADIAAIKNQLQNLKSKTELIEKPNSFVQYYHNYNIYKSQNNHPSALKSLTEAVKYEFFVDTMLDLISLARDVYRDKHIEYLNVKLFPFIDQPTIDFARVYLMQSEAIEEQTIKYLHDEKKQLATLLMLPKAISQLPKGVFVKKVTDTYFIFESENTFTKFCSENPTDVEFEYGSPLLWNFDEGEFKLKSKPFVQQLKIYCTRELGLNRGVDHINIGEGFYYGPGNKNVVEIMIDLMNGDILDAYNNGQYDDLFLDITKLRELLPEEYPERYLALGFKGVSETLMYESLNALTPDTIEKISRWGKQNGGEYWSARISIPVSDFVDRLSQVMETNGFDNSSSSIVSFAANHVVVSKP